MTDSPKPGKPDPEMEAMYKPLQNITAKSGSFRRMRTLSIAKASPRPDDDATLTLTPAADPPPAKVKVKKKGSPVRAKARASLKKAAAATKKEGFGTPRGRPRMPTASELTKGTTALDVAKQLMQGQTERVMDQQQDTARVADFGEVPSPRATITPDYDSQWEESAGFHGNAFSDEYHEPPPPSGRPTGQTEGYQMDAVDIEDKLMQLDQESEALRRLGTESIRHSIRAMNDIEAGVWAGSFFATFASARMLLLCLCGQLLLVSVVAITDRALAFPGWLCFVLAIASVGTGYPAWWEPMTDNHARFHIFITGGAAFATFILVMVYQTEFCTGQGVECTQAQRSKIVGLYTAGAALQLLSVMFAMRVYRESEMVDMQIKMSLAEWKENALAGVFNLGSFQNAGRNLDDRSWNNGHDVENDEELGLLAGEREEPLAVFRDADLNAINTRLVGLDKRNVELADTTNNLTMLLEQSKKRERERLQMNLTLVQKAETAEEACKYVQQKLNIIERDNTRQDDDQETQLASHNQMIERLMEKVASLENKGGHHANYSAGNVSPTRGASRSQSPVRNSASRTRSGGDDKS